MPPTGPPTPLPAASNLPSRVWLGPTLLSFRSKPAVVCRVVCCWWWASAWSPSSNTGVTYIPNKPDRPTLQYSVPLVILLFQATLSIVLAQEARLTAELNWSFGWHTRINWRYRHIPLLESESVLLSSKASSVLVLAELWRPLSTKHGTKAWLYLSTLNL